MENKMNSSGQRIPLTSQYDIIEEIGSGGGGIVYKAYHKNLKKYVVVKQIKDAAKGILDSRTEVDILKNLRNEYLPQVYDFLEIDGEIFTVMDYISGETLETILERQKRVSQKIALKWALELADAIACLHNQNPPIVHGDIKPGNIMVREDGTICLIDFNVSLTLKEERRASVGISEGYASPEQYPNVEMYRWITGSTQQSEDEKPQSRSGYSRNQIYRKTEYVSQNGESVQTETGEKNVVKKSVKKKDKRIRWTSPASALNYVGKGIDTRSDIYSLGAVLYHLITGICPSGEFDQIVPIGKSKVSISKGFARIIEKMMEINPNRRYRNGEELLNALKNIQIMDNIYRRFRLARFAVGAGMIGMYVLSIFLVITGIRLENREKLNRYHQAIEDAEVQIEEGQFSEAQELIDWAIQQFPAQINAYEKEVLRLYSAGEYEECIHYGRNLVNSPQYFVETENDRNCLGNILYIIGNAYYETEDYKNAIVCFENAILYWPDNSAFYCDLGIAYAKAGNREKAEEILSQSESLGLDQGTIYLIQGELEFSAGHSEQSVELFTRALTQMDQENEQIRCVMLCAKAYDQLGDLWIDEEITFLEQWKNYLGYRGRRQIGEKLGEVFARNQEYERALEEFCALKEGGFVSYQLQENIAILYQQTDQFQFAEATLQEMAEQYPMRYETYKHLAFLEADIQQEKQNSERTYIKMKEYYETALELSSGQENADQEMQQLDAMIQELTEGNWFE